MDAYLAARQHGVCIHGVQVGQSDLDAVEVRRLIGPEAPGSAKRRIVGAAVVSWICAAENPQRAAAELAQAWRSAPTR